MKVSEYLPFYGLLFNFEYQTGIEGKIMTVKEMFDNYPDYELDDVHLQQLYYFDLFSLQKILQDDYFTQESVVLYLREMFDLYRFSDGHPLEWLYVTYESIRNNPRNYRIDLRSTLEKTFIEWIEVFEKDAELFSNSGENIITDKLWFKVGLKFADGTIYDLIEKHNSNFEKISRELFPVNPNSYRPYISTSSANTNKLSDKNIFSSNKLVLIKEYCQENGIEMDERFLATIKSK